MPEITWSSKKIVVGKCYNSGKLPEISVCHTNKHKYESVWDEPPNQRETRGKTPDY